MAETASTEKGDADVPRKSLTGHLSLLDPTAEANTLVAMSSSYWGWCSLALQ